MNYNDQFDSQGLQSSPESLKSPTNHPTEVYAVALETAITSDLNISNDVFMSAVFTRLEGDERPVLVEVTGNPSKTGWPRARPWNPGDLIAERDVNAYYSLSTYQPNAEGQWKRSKKTFERAWGIYLDDVGSKALSLQDLPCPPSYVIETSPNNFQVGYLFDQPCRDGELLERLHEQLSKAGFTDPGAGGRTTRLARLPYGVNGKYEPAFRCRLHTWAPERRYSIKDLAEAFSLNLEVKSAPPKKTPSKSRTAVREKAQTFEPAAAENPVVTQLKALGLYKADLGDGKHDVTCPWVNEHTDCLDHGTAYFEPTEGRPMGGFKCLHGHCQGRRIRDLLGALDITAGQARNRAVVRLQPGELGPAVLALEAELARNGYFRRSGQIARVTTNPETGVAYIEMLGHAALLMALSKLVTCERYDARKGDYVACDLSARYVNTLHEGYDYEHLPVLKGITLQPILRADSSLMATDGYDSESGYYGYFNADEFCVLETPTREAALEALGQIEELISEFRFATPHDRAAALALILTAAVRPSLPAAPMGHIRAPQAGSGKSYLASLIACFAAPEVPTAHAFPQSDEECTKLLFAILKTGAPVVLFDNLSSDLKAWDSLCSAVTSPTLTGRELGQSRTMEVSTKVLFLSTGNNADAVRDMARRTITVNLDPACETPAALEYAGQPLQTLLRNRGFYVSQALTIVRAYICAGKPRQDLKALGSFQEWSDLVRSALVWLGLPDPATSIYTRMDEDPDKELLGRMLLAWRRAFGDKAVAIRLVLSEIGTGDISYVPEQLRDLSEVIEEVASERDRINRQRLGHWIKRHEGRVVGGLRFEKTRISSGSAVWRVVHVDTDKSA